MTPGIIMAICITTISAINYGSIPHNKLTVIVYSILQINGLLLTMIEVGEAESGYNNKYKMASRVISFLLFIAFSFLGLFYSLKYCD